VALARPLAGVVAGRDGNMIVIDSSGAAASLNAAELTGFSLQEAAARPANLPVDLQFSAVTALPDGTTLAAPPDEPTMLWAFDPGSAAPRPLPLPGALAAPPLAWRDGIAVACSSGTIAWLDSATGAHKADPFQLSLLPGQRLTACRLAAAGSDGNELIVAERGAIRHLGLVTDPQPQLVEFAVAKIEPAITGLAASEKFVGVLDRRGQWHTFALPDLTSAEASTIAGSAFVIGPTVLGPFQVVATDTDELVALDAQLAPAWKTPLSHGALAGEPVAVAGRALLATRTGWLYRVAVDSGKELAAVDLAQPLAGAPLVIGEYALVPAADGTLLKVPLAALEAPLP
jgi:hypothetical protein